MDTTVRPGLWLHTIFAKNGIALTEQSIQRLEQYVDGVLKANQEVNLISRRDEEKIWPHHILHSLSLLTKLRLHQPCRVLDLGSGGGLPGIPLKIVLPELELTMIDSTRKKIAAVQKIVSEIGLEGVHAVWGRAEELGRERKYVGQFDVVVARAVAPLDELARLAHPFLKVRAAEGGAPDLASGHILLRQPSLVAYKGGVLEGELEKARRIRYVRSLTVYPIVFEGSHEMDLEDKKLVVVEFT